MSTLHPSRAAVGGHHTITAAALLATYMQSVNISVPNAALPHIQATLSMANDEVGWVFSSYIAASAVSMSITQWLAARYGRRTIYQTALAIFALGLVLDTLATTSIQFVLARIVQGAASGPFAPLSLAILLEVTPAARHARMSLAWTVCSLLGISTGPAIGGWLAEYYGWPSIFYFSLPMVAFIFPTMRSLLSEKRAERSKPFDFFGLVTFSVGMIGLQMLLDRGERLEWFASTESWVEAGASVLGFYLFIVHVLTTREHFLRTVLFRDRNLILSTVISFALGFVLLPTLALTSPMLEELLNYPVDTTGYMTIPRGMALVGALVLTSLVPAQVDYRPFLLGGMALVVYANWLMLGYSPAMDWRPVVEAGFLQGAGLGMLLPTLARAAFGTLDTKLRPEGSALISLSRLYGSTIGIAVVQLFFYANTQAMHIALAKHLTPLRVAANTVGSIGKPGLAALNGMVTRQAATIAVIDQFEILMFAMLVVMPLVFFLRRPRPSG
ncbi:multidrug efflux MFS transporter [Bradyrhizobium arachidis]|uniref:MDR family MFS transporter n=1 Tax=Bradyrhizobium TaxID=374 RepID=UPI002162A209|nr:MULTISPECIES: MDR family MFS transporter [Bradyrhizobium]MDN4983038.1 MDR family MFS transporter [Bradyrhizobium sp. WYCCWR 13022]UVO34534.1 multidrug efflux MFS transporter [Bradyrhizobium arachidis]